MKNYRLLFISAILFIASFAQSSEIAHIANPPALFQASAIPASNLIQAEDLVKALRAAGKDKPLIIQVGSRVLYEQAHIPGSEYVGPASTADGIGRLRERMKSVSHQRAIVIYCGCCPWEHCPNVRPAFDTLKSLGFTNLKVLFLAENFGASWVEKGYPTAKGE